MQPLGLNNTVQSRILFCKEEWVGFRMWVVNGRS
uniref:Uncharacterized protein n=1 Tax=Rhizophora mucronata TaxID=61149 RepID=A0A2P2P1R5_RHIMU